MSQDLSVLYITRDGQTHTFTKDKVIIQDDNVVVDIDGCAVSVDKPSNCPWVAMWGDQQSDDSPESVGSGDDDIPDIGLHNDLINRCMSENRVSVVYGVDLYSRDNKDNEEMLPCDGELLCKALANYEGRSEDHDGSAISDSGFLILPRDLNHAGTILKISKLGDSVEIETLEKVSWLGIPGADAFTWTMVYVSAKPADSTFPLRLLDEKYHKKGAPKTGDVRDPSLDKIAKILLALEKKVDKITENQKAQKARHEAGLSSLKKSLSDLSTKLASSGKDSSSKSSKTTKKKKPVPKLDKTSLLKIIKDSKKPEFSSKSVLKDVKSTFPEATLAEVHGLIHSLSLEQKIVPRNTGYGLA